MFQSGRGPHPGAAHATRMRTADLDKLVGIAYKRSVEWDVKMGGAVDGELKQRAKEWAD